MQRTEFSGHRVLILGPKTHAIAILRGVLGTAGVTAIVHVGEARYALELLSMESFHAVFYDPAVENHRDTPFPVAARRKKSVRNPMIPIFAIQERPRRRDVEVARDAGVTDVLTTPISPRTVMERLKTAPRPFIVASAFFGPDRRAKSRAAWCGADRRIRAPKKTKVDLHQF